ncbi:MAG: hypothetical protein AB1349_00125, partial [Elusimicrobiota bacterium]
APNVYSLSPWSAGQGCPYRKITMYAEAGKGFIGWFGKISADFGTTGIIVSSCTYISETQAEAHIKVPDTTANGWYNVYAINPDGRKSNVLVSSFCVTAATSAVNFPYEPITYSDLITAVTGQCGVMAMTPAPLGDLTTAQVRIKRVTDGMYWTGTGFLVSDPNTWVNVDGGGSKTWSYTGWTTSQQQDGKTYKIWARAQTTDGGKCKPIDDADAPEFTFDLNPPQSVINTPNVADTPRLNDSNDDEISGTATDAASGINEDTTDPYSGSGVELMMQDLTLGTSYWDKNGVFGTPEVWVSSPSPVWFKVSYSAGNWSYATVAGPTPKVSTNVWTNSHDYKAHARAQDKVGRKEWEEDPDWPDRAITFIVDYQTPISTITYPSAAKEYYNYDQLSTISGTCWDNVLSGSFKMYVRVWKEPNLYLQSSATWWATTSVWNEVTGTFGERVGSTWKVWLSTYIWTNGTQYRIDCKANDGVNEEPTPWQIPIRVEWAIPQAAITFPTGGAQNQSNLATISGTSNKDVYFGTVQDSGIDKVRYSLKVLDANVYWNSSSGNWESGAEIYNVATNTCSWETWYAVIPANKWAEYDGWQCDFKCCVLDNAGNYQPPQSTMTFRIDFSTPSSTLTNPPPDAKAVNTATLATISGSSYDLPDPPRQSDVSQVNIRIHWLIGPTTYLSNGEVWMETVQDMNVTGVHPWTRTVGSGKWTESNKYELWTRCIDGANNTENWICRSTFTYDNTVPQSYTTFPQDGNRYNSVPTISGTAYDAVAVRKARVRIYRVSDGVWWDPVNNNWGGTADSWKTVIDDPNLPAGTTQWQYVPPSTIWDDDATPGDPPVQYKINVQAEDRVPYVEVSFSTITFTYDKQLPLTEIIQPVHQSFQKQGSLPTISGNCSSDSVAVYVYLRDRTFSGDVTNPSTYWNFATSAWVQNAGSLWQQTYLAGTIWSTGTATWTHLRNYEIGCYANDQATNTGDTVISKFWYDTGVPTSTILNPANNVTLASLTTISGTAYDTATNENTFKNQLTGDSGGDMLISIKCSETGEYFTYNEPDKWSATRQWIGISSGVTISGSLVGSEWRDTYQVSPSTGWMNDYTYHIWRNVKDAANNYEDDISAPVKSTITFTIDFERPLSAPTTPQADVIYAAYKLATISGTASDNRGLDNVKIWLRRTDIAPQDYWNGVGWADEEAAADDLEWQTAASNLPGKTTTWIYTGITWVAGDYNLKTRATDDVGWLENSASTTTGVNFKVDISSPNSTVTLPVANEEYNSITQLQGNATDDKSGIPASGVEFWLQNITLGTTYWQTGVGWISQASPFWNGATVVSPDTNNTAWYYNIANTNFTDGCQYRVQSRAKDNAGLQQEPTVTNTCWYDTTIPTATVTDPADNTEISRWTQVKGTSFDNYPGGGQDRVEVQIIDRGTNNDGDYAWWSEWNNDWVTAASTWCVTSWTMSTGTGPWKWEEAAPPASKLGAKYYRVLAKAYDKAGNYQSILSSTTFKYDTAAPQSKLLDVVEYDGANNNTYTETLWQLHGEAWAGIPIDNVKVSIYDRGQRKYWDDTTSNWGAADGPESWCSCTGKENWYYRNVPPEWYTGATDRDCQIKTKAATAVKPETEGAGKRVYVKRGSWCRSWVSTDTAYGPQHGDYFSTKDKIYIRAVYGNSTEISSVKIRVYNISDSPPVEMTGGWETATHDGYEMYGGGNLYVYYATYTVTFTWTPNKIYKIITQTAYKGGEYPEKLPEFDDDGLLIINDPTAPTIALTNPPANGYYSSMSTISGTMSDNLAGPKQVQIRITDLTTSTTYYWHYWTTSGTWETADYWETTAGYVTMPTTTTYRYDKTTGAWAEKGKYGIRAKVQDNALNWCSAEAYYEFYYDTIKPTTTVTFPANDGEAQGFPLFYGGYYDNLLIDKIDMKLQDKDNSQFWRDDDGDGVGSWSGTEYWVPCYNIWSSSWTYQYSNSNPSLSEWYIITSRAKDKVPNTEDVFTVGSNSNTFIVDITAPQPKIVVPLTDNVNLVRKNLITISGTIYESRSVDRVRITLQNLTLGTSFWSGTQWLVGEVNGSTWVVCSNSGAAPDFYWSYVVGQDTMTSGCKYEVRVWAKDGAGNESASYTGGTPPEYYVEAATPTVKRFIHENSVPISTVTMPSAGSYSQLPSISGTSKDYPEPPLNKAGIYKVYWRVSNDADTLSFVNWQTSGTWQTGNFYNTGSQEAGGWDIWKSSAYSNPFTTDYWYRVRCKAIDDAVLPTNEATGQGNAEAEHTSYDARFRWDVGVPGSAITLPDSDSAPGGGSKRRSQLTNISGTATDDYPNGKINSDGVKVYIRVIPGGGDGGVGTNIMWDGDSWEATPASEDNWYKLNSSYVGVSSGSWTYNFSVIPTTSGWKYNILANAWDAANPENKQATANYDTNLSSRTFIWDQQKPVSAVTWPNVTYVSSLGTISGTSSFDTAIEAGGVNLKVKRMTDDWIWTPTGWQSGGSGVDLTPTDSGGESADKWQYYSLSLIDSLQTGTSYQFITKARDNALPSGNNEDETVKYTIWYDTVPAQSVITYPTHDSETTANPTISGTCSDNLAGVAKIKIKIQDDYTTGGGSSWDGTIPEWNANDNWNDANFGYNATLGYSTWTYVYSGAGLSDWYWVMSRASDTAVPSNVQSSFVVGTSSNRFIADLTAPTNLKFTVPNLDNQDIARKDILTFSGSSKDNRSHYLVQMTLQDLTWGTSFWSGSQWLAGAVNGSTRVVCNKSGSGTEITFDYSVGASTMVSGHKYEVRVWARDNAGNWTANYGDYLQGATDTVKRFWYESTEPNSVILSQTEGQRYSSLTTISGTAEDTGATPYNAGVADLSDGGIKIQISNSDDSKFYFRWASSGTMQASGTGNYFTVGEFAAPPVWSTAALAACADFIDDAQYIIRVKAKDKARPSANDTVTNSGNEEVTISSINFIWDSQAPKVFTTNPQDNAGRKNTLATISGTCVDNNTVDNPKGKMATSNTVELNIVDIDGGPATWKGNGWETGDNPNTWVSTSTFVGYSSGTWSYGITDSTWTSGHQYRIRVRVKDATLPSPGLYSSVCVSTFTYDTARPESAVSYPATSPAYLKTFGTISGTCSDDTQTMKIKIRRNDGRTFLATSGLADKFEVDSADIYADGGNWNTVSPTPPTWSYGTFTDAYLANGYRYEILTKAWDEATNPENITSPLKNLTTFFYDLTIPVRSTITYPTATPETTISIIRGDCSDPVVNYFNTGIAEVTIRIRDTENYLPGGATYWNGAGSWVQDNTHNANWLTCTLSPNSTGWWYNTSIPNWTSDKVYEITARAKDKALNWGTDYSTQTFKRDTSAPVVTLQKPINNDYRLKTLATISGSATDPASTSNVDRVDYAIRNLTLGSTYWNPATGQWIETANTTYWLSLYPTPAATVVWSTGAVSFTAGHYYKISVRAKDAPGNITADANCPIKNFYYDASAPTTTITNITNNAVYSSLPTVSGQAGDNPLPNQSGVKRVEVKIYDGTQYWVPTRSPQWGAEEWYNSQYSGGVWTTTCPWTNDKTYTITYRGEDLCYDESEAQNGNVEADNTRTFTYDTQAPISTTTFPAAPNGQTINWLPTISGTAEDPGTNANLAVKSNSVRINIYNKSDNQTLKADQTWEATDTGLYLTCTNLQDNWTTWQYVITYPTAVWTNGREYRIRTKAYDLADTAETGTPERTFIIDTSSPTPVITKPNATVHNEMATISGTSSSDTYDVKIRTKKFEAGATYWWIGDQWSSTNYDDYPSVAWRAYSGTPANWYYTCPEFQTSSAFTTGTTYYVTARAWDNATNWQDSESKQFRFDNTPPTVSISAPPAQSGRYKTLPTISGYCSDNPAGVQTVYFTLTDGTSWYKDVTQEWLTTVSTGTAVLSANATYWYETPISNYVTDKQYTLKVWAQDTVGNYNYNTYFASLTFIFDSQGPATTIQYPPATKLKSLTTISGTAKETETNYPGVVNNVKIAIKDLTWPNTYYNGVYSSSNCWSVGEQWIDATGGGALLITWQYGFDVNYETNVWTDGHDYTIYAKSYDQTTLNEGSAVSVTFTYDKTAPVSTTTHPLNGKYVQPFVTISGTASSDTKTNGVGIRLRRATAPQYWTGSGDNWLASEPSPWPAASGAATWTKDAAGVFTVAAANGETYYLITRATDTAYNIESLQAERPFTIDSTTPTLTTIKPEANKYYQKTNLVTISGTSVDLAGSNPGKFDNNPVKICIKRLSDDKYLDSDGTWKVWNDLITQPPWRTPTWTFYDVNVATAGYWQFETIVATWTSGYKYMLWVGVNDQATNKIDYSDTEIQGSAGGIIFYCDSDAPVTDVQQPPNNSYLNSSSLPSVWWGNCNEKPDSSPPVYYNSGNKLVQVKIKREPALDGTSWWAYPLWSNTETWNDITVVWPSSWTYNSPSPITHKTSYWVYVQSYDNALPAPGNLEGTGGNVKSLFMYDTQAGTSTISVPLTGEPHYKSFTTISGTCYDDFSSPDKVFIEIFDDTDGTLYYSTNGWTTWQNYFETSGLQPWTTSWTTNIWTNHHKYRVRSKLRDKSQNLEAVKTENTRTFIYDITNPTSCVVEPANGVEGKNITNMPTISGTCVDKNPGLVVGCSVAFRITNAADDTPGNYWTFGPPAGWTSETPFWINTSTSLIADTTYLWKINTNTATWTNNNWYRIYSLSIDKAGNMQNNGTPDTYNRFKYVVPEPVAAILYPATNNSHYKQDQLATISGTVSEGATNMQICIRRDTAGAGDPPGIHYWNAANSTWTVTETWISTGPTQYKEVDFSLSPTWKFEVQESTWTNGAVYTIRAKAYESVYLWGSPSDRTGIVYDKTVPNSTIVKPASDPGYYRSSLATLSGGHSDTSPGLVDKVEIRLKKSVGSPPDDWFWLDTWWSSGTWITEAMKWRTSNSTETANTWYYYMPATACWSTDQAYRLETKATDKAGNVQSVYASSDFTIDDSTPTSRILEPTNGQIRSSLPTISGTATDASLAQLKEVRLAIKDEAGGWYDGNTFTAATDSFVVCGLGFTASQATWTLTGVNWANAKRYTLYLRAKDKAGNYNDTYTVGNTSVTIIADIAPSGNPTSAVDTPAEGIAYSTAVIGDLNMTGTCSDPAAPNNSGIQGSVQGAVKARLLKLTSPTTQYWDGSAWKQWYSTYPFINGPTTDAGGNNWSWLFLGSNLESDKQYTLNTQVYDRAVPAANYEVSYSTRMFYIDNTPPVSKVFEPQNNTFRNALATISGTVDSFISGTYGVGVAIKRNSDNFYWQYSTTGWYSTATWHTASISGSTWTFANVPTWADGLQYHIISMSTDNAKNVENVGASSTTFTCDKTNPPIVISSPVADGNHNTLATISGTADDTLSGISTVKIKVKNDTDAKWWDGTKWDSSLTEASAPWLDCSYSKPNWNYENMQSTWIANKRYMVKAKADDVATNSNTTADTYFTYDVQKPTSAVNCITQSYYNNTLATLSGTANDKLATPNSGLASNGVKIRITNTTVSPNKYFKGGTQWTTDSADPSTWRDSSYSAVDEKWTLTIDTNAWEQDGLQNTFKIESKAIDRASNEETIGAGQTAQFTYDVSKPTTTVFAPVNNGYYGKNNNLPTISGTCTDTGSGVNKVDIVLKNLDGYYFDPITQSWKDAADGIIWSTTTLMGPTSWYVAVSTTKYTSGVNYMVWARVYDGAGNLSTYADSTIDGNTNGHQFKWDIDNPNSYVNYISSGQYINFYPQSLSGTSNDPGASGVTAIKLRLKRDRDPNGEGKIWWVALAWQADEAWYYTVTPGWSWNSSDVTWSDNYQYTILTRAQDNAGNIEGDGAGNVNTSRASVFTIDMSSPTTGITAPKKPYYNTLSTLSGTSSDPNTYASGVKGVDIAIYNTTDGNRWTGSGWETSGTDYYIKADTWTIAPNWQYVIDNSTWTDGKQYRIRTKAYDFATNTQTVATEYLFRCDRSSPTAYVTNPPDGTEGLQQLPTISGTCADTSPGEIDSVYIYVKCLTGDANLVGKYWGKHGDETWEWGAMEDIWTSTSNPGLPTWAWASNVSWQSTMEKYEIGVKPIDKAGNGAYQVDVCTFTIGPPAPKSVITNLLQNRYYSSLANIQGTTANTTPSPGWQGVGIKRLSDNQWWNGSMSAPYWQVAGSSWIVATIDTGPDPDTFIKDIPELFVSYSSYTVQSNGKNPQNVTEEGLGFPAPNVTYTIWYDTFPPYSQVTEPNAAYERWMATISGTAADGSQGAGVNNVDTRIIWTSSTTAEAVNPNWNTTLQKWTTTVFWIPVNWWVDGSSWNYTLSYPTNVWTNGEEYKVVPRATGKEIPALVETPGAGSTFKYDISTPTAKIQYPVDQKAYNTIATISGTLADTPFGNSTILSDGIKIAIQRWNPEPSKWLTPGAGFNSNTPVFFTNNVTKYSSTWTYTGAGSDFTPANDTKYTLLVRAEDSAGNIMDTFDVGIASVSFIYDTAKPVSVVLQPAADGVALNATTIGTISGTTYDPGTYFAEVSSCTILIRNTDDGKYWDGSGWKVWYATYPYISGVSTEAITVQTLKWSYKDISVNWEGMGGDKNCAVNIMAFDKALPDSNDENVVSTRTFIYDNTPPTAVLVKPPQPHLTYIKELSTISGTANGDLAGLKAVRLTIKAETGSQAGKYWQDSTSNWYSTATWNVCTTANNWTYTAVPAWESGAKYALELKTTDYAENVQTVIATTTFLFDNTIPTVGITAPANDGNYGPQNQLLTLTGSCNDPVGAGGAASGVNKVTLLMKDTTQSTTYYNWSTQTWENAPNLTSNHYKDLTPSAGTWSITKTLGEWGWLTNKRYELKAWSTDNAGCVSSTSTYQFDYDDQNPVSIIQMPNKTHHNNTLTQLSGTASDAGGSEFTTMKVMVKWQDQNKYWQGTDWGPSQIWVNAAGVAPWTYSLPVSSYTDNNYYIVYSSGIDDSQNYQTTISSYAFYYDIKHSTTILTMPARYQGTILQYQPFVTISGTSIDENSNASGVKETRIAAYNYNDTKFWNGSAWTASSHCWLTANSLTSGNTIWYLVKPWTWSEIQYDVYSQVIDNAGNVSPHISTSTFKIDSSSPTSSVTLPVNGTARRAADADLVTISGTSSDTNGNVNVVKVYIKRMSGAAKWWNPSGGAFDLDSENVPPISASNIAPWEYTHVAFIGSKFTSGATYWAYSTAWDNAGNQEVLPGGSSSYFVWDVTPPTSTVTNQQVISGYVNSLPTISG